MYVDIYIYKIKIRVANQRKTGSVRVFCKLRDLVDCNGIYDMTYQYGEFLMGMGYVYIYIYDVFVCIYIYKSSNAYVTWSGYIGE